MINDPIEYRKLASAYKNYGIAISISGMSKSYESRQVLNQLDLDILSGEFIAIVGRSGCGKSTLLRILAQLDEAQDGSLTFANRDEKDKSDVRMMFQDSRLLPWRTVLQNVALGLTKKEIPLAEDALNKVGLLDRAHDWPAKLSGGQKQRIALARALVHKPRLLLLDEPLGALDALTRIEMQELIEELWLQHKFTAVLVTHDVQEAVALADRVILLEEGKVGLDLAINLSRSRSRGSPAFANLEAELLERVLKHPHYQCDQKPASEFFDGSETLKFERFNWAV